MRIIPYISIARWHGATGDDLNDAEGYSLAIEWLGFALEFCWGRIQ